LGEKSSFWIAPIARLSIFSTAEQLDRIVQKYWAEAPQFVVLKIDASQLKGKLKYEANPGGLSQYYHLHDGSIPIQAIKEAKITFKESLPSAHRSNLDLVHAGDPVLRKKARPLTKGEILSDEIQDLIQDMKAAMRAAPGRRTRGATDWKADPARSCGRHGALFPDP
jgi:hypothetical protein